MTFILLNIIIKNASIRTVCQNLDLALIAATSSEYFFFLWSFSTTCNRNPLYIEFLQDYSPSCCCRLVSRLLHYFLVQLCTTIFVTGFKDVSSDLGKPSSVKVGSGIEVDLFISVYREKSISDLKADRNAVGWRHHNYFAPPLRVVFLIDFQEFQVLRVGLGSAPTTCQSSSVLK